jgi:hypothetical protein
MPEQPPRQNPDLRRTDLEGWMDHVSRLPKRSNDPTSRAMMEQVQERVMRDRLNSMLNMDYADPPVGRSHQNRETGYRMSERARDRRLGDIDLPNEKPKK